MYAKRKMTKGRWIARLQMEGWRRKNLTITLGSVVTAHENYFSSVNPTFNSSLSVVCPIRIANCFSLKNISWIYQPSTSWLLHVNLHSAKAHVQLPLWNISLSSPEDMLIDFREEGEGEEKNINERETFISYLLYVSRQGLEPTT